MVKLMTVGNHISIGHPPCLIPTTCVTPLNARVFSGGSLVVNTGSPCTPHTFCLPEVHIPITTPTQSKVKVNGKFANTEINPLGCGDLATVFLPSKVEILRSSTGAGGGGAGGGGGTGGSNQPLTRVAYIGGYPIVNYQEAYSEFRIDRANEFDPYRYQEICTFPNTINISEAYTPIIVSSTSADPYVVKNYINVGAAGIPAYSNLNEPVAVDMRLLGAYYFAYSDTKAGRNARDEFLARRSLGDQLNSNSITIENSPQNCTIKNVQSLKSSVGNKLSGRRYSSGFIGALVIDYVAGLNIDGQSYFPSSDLIYPKQVDGAWVEGYVQSAVIRLSYKTGRYC